MIAEAPVLAACEWIFAGQDVRALLRRLSAAGCDGLEVSGEPARPDRGELAAALQEAGMQATGITAICPAPTDERDLSHPDPAARRRAVDYYRGCVDLAREVGAPTVGLIPAAIGRVDGLVSESWPLAVEAAREVADYAGEHGVTLGVEAVNRYETFLVNTAEQALEFADQIGNAGVVLDAFHMQLEEEDSLAAVMRAAPRLRALHLADSNRLGLGHGQLDAAPLVAAARDAGFTGPLVFEFTAPGPNPFNPDKGAAAMRELDAYARESVAAVQAAL
ncbi:MAG: sugar phosphate isomerase/epimerase family protein [Thermoleophilaceae bacterium]